MVPVQVEDGNHHMAYFIHSHCVFLATLLSRLGVRINDEE